MTQATYYKITATPPDDDPSCYHPRERTWRHTGAGGSPTEYATKAKAEADLSAARAAWSGDAIAANIQIIAAPYDHPLPLGAIVE